MMKKLLLMIAGAFVLSTSLFAKEVIPFTVHYEDEDADITMVPGSTLIVRNNGVVNMATGNTFKAPVGAILNIESGEIY